jgi:hypothetical protein
MIMHRSDKRSRGFIRVVFVCCAVVIVVFALIVSSPIRKGAAQSGPPRLLTRANTTRAIALESVTLYGEPFPLTQPIQFGIDNRTRILLFVENLGLLTGEGAEAVTAEAEDGNRITYPLVVERVDAVTGYSWIRALVIRLNQNLGDAGDVLIGITVRGRASNRVRVGIGHVGGGPPDDPPTTLPPPDLGAGASLHGNVPFPADNPWNQDISNAPVDPNSNNLIASIGNTVNLHPDFGTVWNGAPNGIPYIVVSGTQPLVPMNFIWYDDESDPGPYPVPPDAPIEGGPGSTGDRHVLVIDRDNWKLYEMGNAYPVNGGASWNAGGGAIFDLNSNALRPAGWTSADAAGLPIFPGLVRYDEVFEQGEIKHALRFTAQNTRRAYVYPARHFASNDTNPNRPPMGMRVRLKASFNISTFSPRIQVILIALKKYGMFLADNGSNWYISGAPDPRWSDNELNALKTIAGSNFEVVQMGTIVTQ